MGTTLSPWTTAGAAALVIAAINLLVLAIGHLVGADMLVAQTPGAAPMQIGIGSVLLMSVAPAALGGLALWFSSRFVPRAWRAVGWLGLALALATVAMPFSVSASAVTSVTLASMHVTAGLLWFIAVRRTSPRQHDARIPGAAMPADQTAGAGNGEQR